MSPTTKKRILFVDDESLVLQALQRMLRPMRDDWEMKFVESGPKALEVMEEQPFDVVVCDMIMPGMDGAELLNQLKVRHPKTVRLILSGHANQELVLKCIGTAHQYLAKPCDPETLKTTVARTTALGFTLHNERLMALVSDMERLPSLPALYEELVRLLGVPDVSMEEVGSVIAKDIAMTAKILKLVNSAFFGLSRPIVNPAEAASYLGAEVIKSLVLVLHVFGQFEGAKVEGFSVETLWQHSLQVANGARLIALAERAGSSLVNEAFVGGMLHDAGKLVLAVNYADQFTQTYRLAQEKKISLLEAEREVFGAGHAEVGGYLLGLWGLPVPVVEAIALHHHPGASFTHGFCPLTAVHAANAFGHESNPTLLGPPSAPVEDQYLADLGLADRLPLWRAAVQPTSSASS